VTTQAEARIANAAGRSPRPTRPYVSDHDIAESRARAKATLDMTPSSSDFARAMRASWVDSGFSAAAVLVLRIATNRASKALVMATSDEKTFVGATNAISCPIERKVASVRDQVSLRSPVGGRADLICSLQVLRLVTLSSHSPQTQTTSESRASRASLTG
jgi:hypothetical protein